MTPYKENHKRLLEELEYLLKEAIVSVEKTDEMLLSMIASYRSMNLAQLEAMQSSKNQESDLNIQINTLIKVSEKAKNSVDEIGKFSKSIQSTIDKDEKLSTSLNKENMILNELINKFYNDYELFLDEVKLYLL